MAIKKILYVIAVIITLIGLSQLVFAHWWLDRMPGLVHSDSFYLWGLPGVLFGVVLLIGIMERVVGFRLFMGILSAISIVGGGFVLARPDSARRIAESLLLDRSYGVQMFGMWLTGLVRMAIGIVLFWALIRSEVALRQPEEEISTVRLRKNGVSAEPTDEMEQ